MTDSLSRPTPALRLWSIDQPEAYMKYLLAWLLGVPGTLLVLIFIFSRVL